MKLLEIIWRRIWLNDSWMDCLSCPLRNKLHSSRSTATSSQSLYHGNRGH